MDTTTVLAIIKMIEVRIKAYEESPNSSDDDVFGAQWELMGLRDYLQSFIEAQLSAEENRTGE